MIRYRPPDGHVVLNRRRLPVSKEAKIDAYRAGLEAAGVDTAGWFERQLALSIIAVMATFLWGKALGDADELVWWFAHVAKAQAWLPRPRRAACASPGTATKAPPRFGRIGRWPPGTDFDAVLAICKRGLKELGCTVVPGP
jgi:hypothetical protein